MGKKSRNSLQVVQEENIDPGTARTASKSRAAKTFVQEFLNESHQSNENVKKKKKGELFLFPYILEEVYFTGRYI